MDSQFTIGEEYYDILKGTSLESSVTKPQYVVGREAATASLYATDQQSSLRYDSTTTTPIEPSDDSTRWWPTILVIVILVIVVIGLIIWSSNRGRVEDIGGGDDGDAIFDPDLYLNVEAFELKNNMGWSEGVLSGSCMIQETDVTTGELTGTVITGVSCYSEPFQRTVQETTHTCEEETCVSPYTGQRYAVGETETYLGPCLGEFTIPACQGSLARLMFLHPGGIANGAIRCARYLPSFQDVIVADALCQVLEDRSFTVETRQTVFAKLTYTDRGTVLAPPTTDNNERVELLPANVVPNQGFTWLLVPSTLYEGNIYPQCIAFWAEDTNAPPPSFARIVETNPYVLAVGNDFTFVTLNIRFNERDVTSTARLAYYVGFDLYLNAPANIGDPSSLPVVPFY